MDRPDVVEGLVSSCDDAFTDKLSARLCGLLGSISDLGVRRSFALMGLTAERMGRNRVALAGEAAHALPPIGAQGLNLGLSDAAVLADVVVAARRAGADIGAPEVLDAYDRARSADVHRRVRAVDLLNRSVLTEYWPLGLARGAGLHVLAGVPALRRRLMQEGLFPPAPLPSLLRPLEPGERLADRPPVLLSG
jgi:2-octaprenyl-6-methoxyphenol hydroxylase